MSHDPEHPCVDARVDPLLSELREAVKLHRAAPGDPRRAELEAFVAAVFRSSCGARIQSFLPELLAFEAGAALCAVVGCRGAAGQHLFAEHYLDRPAERVIGAVLGREVRRAELVEVGNLALAYPGQARWVIAATTAFLAAAGYRWVIFTAAGPLFNAFGRLGLRPVPLAAADPKRLADGGAAWGRYYDAQPRVYAGDVRAGLAKLRAAVWSRRGHSQALLGQARALGTRAAERRWSAAAEGARR